MTTANPASLIFERGLLQCTGPDGVRWFHANPNRNTQKLRLRPIASMGDKHYREKTIEEIIAEYPQVTHFSFEQLSKQTGLPVITFSVDESTAWVLVVERMERRMAFPPAKVIPITPLREFYQWLRDRPSKVNKEFLHHSLANSFLQDPSKLTSLFVESCQVFEPYDNSDEPFVESRDDERFLKSQGTGTNKVVKALQANQGQWHLKSQDGQIIDFRVVDREVGTRRSSRKSGVWCYEDGSPTSDSGAGGIDVLLASLAPQQPQLPIVGEIKVKYDETPFSALIQAFTYAAELCTTNQIKRLKKAYPRDFDRLGDSVGVEVFVISSEPVPQHEPILATTMQLAEALYRDLQLSSLIRRIAFLEVELDAQGTRFTCHGVFPRFK